MKRITSAILLILAALWSVTGCIDAPSFESVPILSNAQLELGSPVVVPGDSAGFVTILVDFTDGDGDIGHPTTDSINDLFLENTQIYEIDSLGEVDTTRIDTTISSFLIPVLPSTGGVPDISGTIRVKVLDPAKPSGTFEGFCLIDRFNPDAIVNGPLTEVRYRIWIKDRAGNVSNILDVPPIPINCN